MSKSALLAKYVRNKQPLKMEPISILKFKKKMKNSAISLHCTFLLCFTPVICLLKFIYLQGTYC